MFCRSLLVITVTLGMVLSADSVAEAKAPANGGVCLVRLGGDARESPVLATTHTKARLWDVQYYWWGWHTVGPYSFDRAREVCLSYQRRGFSAHVVPHR